MQAKKDLSLGTLSENESIPQLANYFKTEIVKSSSKYCVYDFESDSALFELKTRRNSSTAFIDTMIGLNKIDFARNSSKPFYFCFRFTDGLFYWLYDKEMEDEVLRFAECGRTDRGRQEIKPYAYIKCSFLNKIT